MNLPLSIEQLKQLKDIMSTMLAEANNANWQELSRLDSERRVLIGYTERSRTTADTTVGRTAMDDQTSSRSRDESPGKIRHEVQVNPLSRPPLTKDSGLLNTTSSPEISGLSAEITALDKEINTTVLNARHALLEQTRELRAQVSAKKKYEQANTMKISSYS